MRAILSIAITLATISAAFAQDYLPYLGSGASMSDPFKFTTVGDTISNTNTTGFTEVTCALVGGQSTAVVITMGQSTANNGVLGASPYTPTETNNHQYSLLHDKCYRTRGLGLTSSGTSQWWQARLGDKLINTGAYQRVILVPLGYNTNSRDLVADQTAPQMLNRIAVLMRRLISRGIPPTHIVFALGDGDCLESITGAQFTANINRALAMYRSFAGTRKYLINIQSYHPSCSAPAYGQIHDVQVAAVATFGANVVLGADADSITAALYREDGIHWSQTGSDTIAGMLRTIIAANPRRRDRRVVSDIRLLGRRRRSGGCHPAGIRGRGRYGTALQGQRRQERSQPKDYVCA